MYKRWLCLYYSFYLLEFPGENLHLDAEPIEVVFDAVHFWTVWIFTALDAFNPEAGSLKFACQPNVARYWRSADTRCPS